MKVIFLDFDGVITIPPKWYLKADKIKLIKRIVDETAAKIKADTKVCVIYEEATGYVFPEGTTGFLSPMMPPMSGFARTTPSYETDYQADQPLGKNGDGYGYVFPALFKNRDRGWVLVSETGVNGTYCGGRLIGNADGSYKLAFPMPEEIGGNGTSTVGMTIPGCTPWRTLTVAPDLKPIVETTVAWDVVEPQYEASQVYEPSRGSWSWILKMDNNTTYPVQIQYVDFSAAMGWETILVDAALRLVQLQRLLERRPAGPAEHHEPQRHPPRRDGLAPETRCQGHQGRFLRLRQAGHAAAV